MIEIIKPKTQLEIQALSLDVKQKTREKKIRNNGESRTEALVINSEVFNKFEEWVFKQEKPVRLDEIQSSLEDYDIQVTVQQWKLLLKAGGWVTPDNLNKAFLIDLKSNNAFLLSKSEKIKNLILPSGFTQKLLLNVLKWTNTWVYVRNYMPNRDVAACSKEYLLNIAASTLFLDDQARMPLISAIIHFALGRCRTDQETLTKSLQKSFAFYVEYYCETMRISDQRFFTLDGDQIPVLGALN